MFPLKSEPCHAFLVKSARQMEKEEETFVISSLGWVSTVNSFCPSQGLRLLPLYNLATSAWTLLFSATCPVFVHASMKKVIFFSELDNS